MKFFETHLAHSDGIVKLFGGHRSHVVTARIAEHFAAVSREHEQNKHCRKFNIARMAEPDEKGLKAL